MTILDLVRPRSLTTPRFVPLALLLLAVAIAMAVVGAFGSYVVMGLPLRLIHFTTTSLALGAVTFALTAALRRYVFAGDLPFWTTMLIALATAPLGGLLIQQSLRLWAPVALRHVSLGELTAQVLLINLFVGTLTWVLLRQPGQPAEFTSEDLPPAHAEELSREFRAKLPIPLRQAPVVALSAEDHYVRVRTDRGQTLILMNLSEAIAALGPGAGVRIHRSHWLSRAMAVEAALKGARPIVRIDDNTALPVSRAGRKLLNELHETA